MSIDWGRGVFCLGQDQVELLVFESALRRLGLERVFLGRDAERLLLSVPDYGTVLILIDADAWDDWAELRFVRDRHPHAQIIVFKEYLEKTEVAQFLREGIYTFYLKPLDGVLLDCLRSHLALESSNDDGLSLASNVFRTTTSDIVVH